jgi:hypothetical protein
LLRVSFRTLIKVLIYVPHFCYSICHLYFPVKREATCGEGAGKNPRIGFKILRNEGSTLNSRADSLDQNNILVPSNPVFNPPFIPSSFPLPSNFLLMVHHNIVVVFNIIPRRGEISRKFPLSLRDGCDNLEIQK